MKKIFLFTALLLFITASAQKKKPQKIVPPPPIREIPPPPKIEKLSFEEDDKKCFVYKNEELKDSLMYVTETLLEYGWHSDLARMIITTYNYDPIKKEQTEKAGYLWGQAKTMQFIEGIFKIEKDVFTFIPTKKDRFETQSFKITYQSKTKKIDFLTDENNNKLQTGECLQPMVSM